ncbi:hypothetical protein PP301_gp098 [Gordonia phage GMA2]|uniref:Uncharacterized protein n=1 Tax=Gordonia phage GMA2 TaxID=1647283 RepID=A0A0K0N6Q8_9CAUD|nr:hypothetical protein PP301_gp098 [Gordonia phage GMA2]AKJ72624.1 hypothetical protein GMA2_86 [Gordonia phage GMA2]
MTEKVTDDTAEITSLEQVESLADLFEYWTYREVVGPPPHTSRHSLSIARTVSRLTGGEKPLTVEELGERLGASRSNASESADVS